MAPKEHDLAFWHERYLQQAQWTASLRRRLLAAAGLPSGGRILEVGSGTGAVTTDLARLNARLVLGLDLNHAANVFACATSPGARFVTGNGLRLPFPAGAFDASVCHFLLLWVDDRLQLLREMRRVTIPGGWVACLAEPDYGGRIDFPEALAQLGRWQAQSLRRQGANPQVGRTLLGLMHQAGLEQLEAGVLGGEWAETQIARPDPMEWATLRVDLAGSPEATQIPALEAADRKARAEASRILYVPTFYAHGRAPAST